MGNPISRTRVEDVPEREDVLQQLDLGLPVLQSVGAALHGAQGVAGEVTFVVGDVHGVEVVAVLPGKRFWCKFVFPLKVVTRRLQQHLSQFSCSFHCLAEVPF